MDAIASCSSTLGAKPFRVSRIDYKKVNAWEEEARVQEKLESLISKAHVKEVLAGRKPPKEHFVQMLSSRKPPNERFFQKVVEKYLGKSHMKVGFSITDATTDNAHVEIKRWKRYKEAIGQLSTYDTLLPRPERHAYMFDEVSCSAAKIQEAKKVMARENIKLYTFEIKFDMSEVFIIDESSGLVVFTYDEV
jgi:hypothetical protein